MNVPVDLPYQRSPSAFWKSLIRFKFADALMKRTQESNPAQEPLHCSAPRINGADVAAVYCGERVAGDFYEFLRVSSSRVLFVMLDIAGLRADTREILCSVQQTFRQRSTDLFAETDLNETTAMIQLCYEMNRTIMRRGVRSCPAFIGCYNEDLGTVCYANAGHTPALLRDRSGISLLSATGLPLGLFSHTTQGANTYHLEEESGLLLVSRGVVDAISLRNDVSGAGSSSHFGMAGVVLTFEQAPLYRAYGLCLAMLRSAQHSAPQMVHSADLTTLALVRIAKESANEREFLEPGLGAVPIPATAV